MKVLEQLRKQAANCTVQSANYAKCIISNSENIAHNACAKEFAEFTKCLTRK